MIGIVLAAVAAVLALPAIFDLARRGDLRRLAVRNMVRRRVETALVIGGAALGTTIIASALIVGDTFERSTLDIVERQLGEVDLVVEVPDDNLADIVATIADPPIEAIDGMFVSRNMTVSIASGPADAPGLAVEPRQFVAMADFAKLVDFGSVPDSGLTDAVTPRGRQVLLTAPLADELEVATGDQVWFHVLTRAIPVEVVGIVPAEGTAGLADAWADLSFVATADERLVDLMSSVVVVSATGGVFDSVAAAGVVESELADRLWSESGDDSDPVTIQTVKANTIENAEREGAEMTTIFSVVGGFSVLAGIVLLVNLFVMLAEERKPNLGVLRALGWKRSTMRRALRAEGVIYALPGAVIGAGLGIAAGWGVVRAAQAIFSNNAGRNEFELRYTVEPASLVTAGLIGLVLAMAAMWVTAWRISRLNIVAAIRDIPEPRLRRRVRLRVGLAAVLVLVGAGLWALGFGTDGAYPALVGPPLAIVGLALIAAPFIGAIKVLPVAGAAAVAWVAAFFSVAPSSMTEETNEMFFLVFGVIGVGGAVSMAVVVGPLLQRVLARAGSPNLAARVALAYPSARLGRTASSLAMYCLIIFALAFMAVLAKSEQLNTATVVESTSLGHDVSVRSSRFNPVPPAGLVLADGVAAVHPVKTASLPFWPLDEAGPWDSGPGGEQLGPDDEAVFGGGEYVARGVTKALAETGNPTLASRAERFGSDAEVFAAVAEDPGLAIVAEWFFDDYLAATELVGTRVGVGREGGGFGSGSDLGRAQPSSATETDDAIDVIEVIEVEVVGVTANDYTWASVWLSNAVVVDLQDPPLPATAAYLVADPGVDPAQLASTLEADFVTYGARADSFTDMVERVTAINLGFFALLRAYLLIGLVIGIAGLGVTLYRAVRERRRQIAMMRAMGTGAAAIRSWFMAEATFLSLLGIVSGALLGVLTGYMVATRTTGVLGEALPFAVPWGPLVAISVIPFVASLLAAVIPARRAAQLRPAEALRLSD